MLHSQKSGFQSRNLQQIPRRQNGPQNQDFLVADLTNPCMCMTYRHFFVLSSGCQVLVPLPNHFRRVDPPYPCIYMPKNAYTKSGQISTMSMYMHRQGGGRPSESGWEVGRVPDNHLTSFVIYTFDQIWTNLDNVYVYAWVGGGSTLRKWLGSGTST